MTAAKTDNQVREIDDPELAPVLKFHPVVEMTADQFFDFCQLNRDYRIERLWRNYDRVPDWFGSWKSER